MYRTRMYDFNARTKSIEIMISSRTAELFTINSGALLKYFGAINEVKMQVIQKSRVGAGPINALSILGERERVTKTECQILQIMRVVAVCYRFFQLE